MNRGFFVTATGTGAGKTVFAAGLLIKMAEMGMDAAPMKAVQTGAAKPGIAPDLGAIFKMAGFKPEKKELRFMQPFVYRDACSPHLAAEREKRACASADAVKKAVKKLMEKHGAVVAEGAGGLLAPVSRRTKETMADVIKASGLTAILVCPAGLGAINLACLSINEMKRRGIKLAGFVLNDLEGGRGPEYIKKDNVRIISEMTGIKCLGTVPRMKKPGKRTLSSAIGGMTPVMRLIRGLK